MVVSTPVRVCRTDTCSDPVPPVLSRHGICFTHFLDDAFTGATKVLESCQRGLNVSTRTVNWLREQGDLAVKLLSSGSAEEPDERSRLLELLLCLANVQDCLKKQSGVKK